MNRSAVLIALVVVLGSAYLLSALSDLPFWHAIAIALAALVINGLIATVEDDSPGGFNNPDGTATPRYVTVLTIIGRLLLIVFVVSCLVVLALWKFD